MPRLLRQLAILVVLALPLAAVRAGDDPDFVEGIEYRAIRPPLPTTAGPGQVEVTELFWYGCPHCYRLEPHLEKWVAGLPKDVVFRRVPALFRPVWKLHGAAYYTARLLGVADRIHRPLFDAIHKDRRPLNTPEALADFFAGHGVDREKFLAVFDSFAVRTRLAQAEDYVRASGADSVPTLIVNGKYLTNASMNGGSRERLFEVLDYLLARERKAAGS